MQIALASPDLQIAEAQEAQEKKPLTIFNDFVADENLDAGV
jgi:hypothetical protein